MKEKQIDGKRFLYRGQHRTRSVAEKSVKSLQRGGRRTRIIQEGKMFQVWATSMFD